MVTLADITLDETYRGDLSTEDINSRTKQLVTLFPVKAKEPLHGEDKNLRKTRREKASDAGRKDIGLQGRNCQVFAGTSTQLPYSSLPWGLLAFPGLY